MKPFSSVIRKTLFGGTTFCAITSVLIPCVLSCGRRVLNGCSRFRLSVHPHYVIGFLAILLMSTLSPAVTPSFDQITEILQSRATSIGGELYGFTVSYKCLPPDIQSASSNVAATIKGEGKLRMQCECFYYEYRGQSVTWMEEPGQTTPQAKYCDNVIHITGYDGKNTRRLIGTIPENSGAVYSHKEQSTSCNKGEQTGTLLDFGYSNTLNLMQKLVSAGITPTVSVLESGNTQVLFVYSDQGLTSRCIFDFDNEMFPLGFKTYDKRVGESEEVLAASKTVEKVGHTPHGIAFVAAANVRLFSGKVKGLLVSESTIRTTTYACQQRLSQTDFIPKDSSGNTVTDYSLAADGSSETSPVVKWLGTMLDRYQKGLSKTTCMIALFALILVIILLIIFVRVIRQPQQKTD